MSSNFSLKDRSKKVIKANNIKQKNIKNKKVINDDKKNINYSEEYKNFKSVDYTKDQIINFLVDYNEVEKEEWINIPVNTHIRYLRTDGKFRRGGFVQNIYNKDSKYFIMIQNGFDENKKGYVKFPVAFNDISRLWANVVIENKEKEMKDEIKNELASKINNCSSDMFSEISSLELRIETLEENINSINKQLKQILTFLFKKFPPKKCN